MLYETILCVVDAQQNQLTQDRVTEFVRLTGTAVHLVYLASEYSIPGSPEADTDVEIDQEHVKNLQEYLARAIASGVQAHGEIVPATHYERSDAILDRAKAVKADLVILNTEIGGQRAKARLAEKIVAHNDKMAVLIARSTAFFE